MLGKFGATAVALLLTSTAQAQDVDLPRGVTQATAEPAAPIAGRSFTQAEIADIPRPTLAFEQDDRSVADFDKYYYFHRADVSFDKAYADITECDQLSSGISYYAATTYTPYQNSVAGAVGTAIGSALANLIVGSANKRAVRRINMRNCMGFKGYDRYGLAKDLWQKFHFEEGNGRKRDDVREAALLQQALVASGPKPETEALAI